MNYLAHIFLSGNDRCIQIGNFIGDGVKGDGYKQYPRKFQQGILLHREIDAFSDRHPLVREAVGIGRETFGRYSAVVNDILFDYFLASRFQDYAGLPLKRFSRRFYTALAWNYRHLPERFQGFIWHFILTDRLCRYASLTGIQQSLEIMTRYRGLQIDHAQTPLFMQEHGERLQKIFREFFPELHERCKQSIYLNSYSPKLIPCKLCRIQLPIFILFSSVSSPTLTFRINGIDMNSFGLIIEFHHILIHSRIQMEGKRSFLWYFLLGLSPIYLLSKTNINWFEYLNLSCVTE